MRLRSRVVCLMVPVLLLGCEEAPKQEPDRTEPWRAQPSAEVKDRLLASYSIEPRGVARFTLSAREATHQGEVRVARGKLDVDLLNLDDTRGHIDLDLGALAVAQSVDGGTGDNHELTQQARNWLRLGASRPSSDIDRLRWASFRIKTVERTSSPAAHTGRKVAKLPMDAGPDATSDAGTKDAIVDARSVRLDVVGDLTINEVRVEARVQAEAQFYYASEASAEAKPIKIQLKTRKAFKIGLATHDIQPRNALGVVIAKDHDLLGIQVGKVARVSADLAATLRP